MTEAWVFSFILDLFLAIFALFARVQQGSWLAPGAFFALYWSAFVILSLFAVQDFNVAPAGILWILFAVFTVYTGTMLGSGGMLFKRVRPLQGHADSLPFYRLRHLNLPWLSHLTLICSILGFGAVITLTWSTGGLSTLLSITSLAKMARDYSLARYGIPGYREPELAVFLFIFVYTGGLFGGTLFAIKSSKYHCLIALMPLIPAILVFAVLSTRASIYFTAVLWLAAYFSAVVGIKKGRGRLFILKLNLLAFTLVSMVLAVVMGGYVLRSGTVNLNTDVVADLLHRASVDIFGSLPAFSQWFKYYWCEEAAPKLCAFTFTSPCAWLGISERIRTTPVEIGPYGITTTIYTLFYGLIKDFTLVGSLIVLFIGGILAGRSFRQVARGKIAHLPILVAFYAITLTSFTGCLFAYTTILMAWIIFSGYLAFVKIRNKVVIKNRTL